jgi:hypothetical protein
VAALVYQHSSYERQREAARRLDALARGTFSKSFIGQVTGTTPNQA